MLVAVLAAGCSSGSSSPSTTAKKTTKTTLSAGSATNPGPKDKAACADYAALKASGTTPTKAEYRKLIKDLRHAEYKKLRSQGIRLGKAILAKNSAHVTTALDHISATCTTMGLG